MKKAVIENLLVETTRRCNMRCAHCLRGGNQQKDLDTNIVDSLLAGVEEIHELNFTGGEPSLNPDAMWYFLAKCRELSIPVHQVWLATNGKSVTDAFLNACREWQRYTLKCSLGPNERTFVPDEAKMVIEEANSEERLYGCFVSVSLDKYHEEIPSENLYRLLTLPHVTLDKYIDKDMPEEKWVFMEGRAKAHNLSCKTAKEERPWMFDEHAKHIEVDDTAWGKPYIEQMYVAVDGAVLKNCDYSYADMKKYTALRVSPDPEKKGQWLNKLLMLK